MKSSIIALTAALALTPGLAGAQARDRSSLTLREAVQLALDRHPSMRAAHAFEAGADAAVGELTASRLPQVSTNAALTQFQEPMVVAPFHAFDPSRPPVFDETLLQGNVSLSYTVFDGGRRGAGVAGARAELGVAVAGTEGTQTALIAEVARAYLAVLTAQGTLDAQHLGVEALTAERDRVQRVLDEGRAARVDVLRVEAALARAEAAQSSATVALGIARRHLDRMIGANATTVGARELVQVTQHPTALAPDRGASLERLEQNNPQLLQARHRVAVAEAGRRAARAAWFPRLQLVGGYLGFASSAGDLTAEWQAGVRLSYPLFMGGGRSRAAARATALEVAAQEQYQLALLQVSDAVDRALGTIDETEARVVAMESAADYLAEVVRIERLRLETGAGTEADFLREEADLRHTRAELVAARNAALAARIELARLTGDLTVGWLDRTLEDVP